MTGETPLGWGEERVAKGVVERAFAIEVAGRRVPGACWRPEGATAPTGLVMLGHGGGANKRAPYLLAIARWLARRHGVAAFAIDGPGHGDRLPPDAAPNFENVWQAPETTDNTIADWHGALEFVQSTVGTTPLGYWGLSMGTMMGLPLIAGTPAVRVALLGLMGVWGPTADRLRQDAPTLACPVRFLVQWDDEIVPRETALTLFTLIGSEQKTLHGNPGLHQAVPAQEMRASTGFLAAHLKA